MSFFEVFFVSRHFLDQISLTAYQSARLDAAKVMEPSEIGYFDPRNANWDFGEIPKLDFLSQIGQKCPKAFRAPIIDARFQLYAKFWSRDTTSLLWEVCPISERPGQSLVKNQTSEESRNSKSRKFHIFGNQTTQNFTLMKNITLDRHNFPLRNSYSSISPFWIPNIIWPSFRSWCDEVRLTFLGVKSQ
jgi:hypothetical protein